MINAFSCEFLDDSAEEIFLSASIETSHYYNSPVLSVGSYSEKLSSSLYLFSTNMFSSYMFYRDVTRCFGSISIDRINSFLNGSYSREIFLNFFDNFSRYNHSIQNVSEYIHSFEDSIIEKYFYPILCSHIKQDLSSIPLLPLSIKVSLNSLTGKNIYSSLFTSFSRYKDNPSLYPIAVRHITDSGYVVVERPPFRFKLNFKTGAAWSSARPMRQHEIWAPWTLTFINPTQVLSRENINHDVYIYVSDGSLDEFGQRKYIPCVFPNSYNDAKICFSNSLNDLPAEQKSSTDITSIYHTVFNDYFSGGWNCDINNGSLSASYGCDFSEYNSDFFHRPSYSFLSSKQKQSLSSSLSLSNYSTKKQYSNFFNFMAGLDLQETLSFYSKLCSKSGLSFNEIIKNRPFSSSYIHTYSNGSSNSVSAKITSLAKKDYSFTNLSGSYSFDVLLQNIKVDNSKYFNIQPLINGNERLNKDLLSIFSSYSSVQDFLDFLLTHCKSLIDDSVYSKDHFISYNFSNKTSFVSSDYSKSSYTLYNEYFNQSLNEILENV